jgi:hypothetical protein
VILLVAETVLEAANPYECDFDPLNAIFKGEWPYEWPSECDF